MFTHRTVEALVELGERFTVRNREESVDQRLLVAPVFVVVVDQSFRILARMTASLEEGVAAADPSSISIIFGDFVVIGKDIPTRQLGDALSSKGEDSLAGLAVRVSRL